MDRTDRTLYLLLGWLPMGALFVALVVSQHGTDVGSATWVGVRMIAVAAPLSMLVYRFAGRVPWPRTWQPHFFLVHIAAAVTFSASWFAGGSLIESVFVSLRHRSLVLALVDGPGIMATLIFGLWIYAIIAGVAYAHRATQRSAEAQALAARTQLAALRAQLHPHFLFNALHTIVQLIPLDPARATSAAEELAAILRRVIDQRADVVTLAEEWDFVQRYLGVETLRFAQRLRVEADLDAAARESLVPAFAVQTLVENAVRHGAAPLVRTTCIRVVAQRRGDVLHLSVDDDGAGASTDALNRGTGLARLRERLAWLCGDAAQLAVRTSPGAGFHAELQLGQRALSAARQEDADD